MEWNIDAFERDRGKAPLEVDRLWFGFGLFGASTNNFDELSLDLFEGLGLYQGLNVNFLRFQKVGDIRKTIQCTKLQKWSAVATS